MFSTCTTTVSRVKAMTKNSRYEPNVDIAAWLIPPGRSNELAREIEKQAMNANVGSVTQVVPQVQNSNENAQLMLVIQDCTGTYARLSLSSGSGFVVDSAHTYTKTETEQRHRSRSTNLWDIAETAAREAGLEPHHRLKVAYSSVNPVISWTSFWQAVENKLTPWVDLATVAVLEQTEQRFGALVVEVRQRWEELLCIL